MKKLKLIVCDTEFDRYAYLTNVSQTTQSYECEHIIDCDNTANFLENLNSALQNYEMKLFQDETFDYTSLDEFLTFKDHFTAKG